MTTDSNAAGSEPTPPDRKQAAAASSNKSHESEEIGEPADTSEARDADERDTLKSEADDTANAAKRDPPACAIRVLGQCLVAKEKEEAAPNPKPAGGTAKSAASKPPPPMRAGLTDVAQATALLMSKVKAGTSISRSQQKWR